MQKIIISIIVAALAAFGVYYFFFMSSDTMVEEELPDVDTSVDLPDGEDVTASSTDQGDAADATDEPMTTIGQSAGGTDIVAYHYGSGDTNVLFVGGLHAGYSANTVAVAEEMMAYFENNEDAIPDGVRVTVIPTASPDSAGKSGVNGRLNANGVDLNRNFDCEWQAEGVWQQTPVSGGSAAFSEPEAQAIRDYVTANTPDAAVVYYSAAGGVYASSCNNGVSAGTKSLMNTYATAAGYTAHETFDFYEITGDMVNWMAKNNVAAISVLLTDHQNAEWTKNKAGIDAVLAAYAN